MGCVSFGVEDIHKYRDGDPTALRRFIDCHGEFIMAAMLKVLRDEDDVNDCFSKLMEELPNKLNRFDVTRPLRPFLWTVATNKARKKLEEDLRNPTAGRGTTPLHSIQEPSLPHHTDPETEFMQKEELELVKSVARSFGHDINVEAFSAWHFRGYSYKEIAELYGGITETNVRNRISRGKSKVINRAKKMYPDNFHER